MKIEIEPAYPLDVSKIKTIDDIKAVLDVMQISFQRVSMPPDDFKKIEHLINKENV